MSRKKSLGSTIAFLRDEASLSQEALAEKSGVHRTYISQLERDLKSPTVETLTRIAKALEMKLSTLIQLTEKGSDELQGE